VAGLLAASRAGAATNMTASEEAAMKRQMAQRRRKRSMLKTYSWSAPRVSTAVKRLVGQGLAYKPIGGRRAALRRLASSNYVATSAGAAEPASTPTCPCSDDLLMPPGVMTAQGLVSAGQRRLLRCRAPARCRPGPVGMAGTRQSSATHRPRRGRSSVHPEHEVKE
jgi:hypothetical protein